MSDETFSWMEMTVRVSHAKRGSDAHDIAQRVAEAVRSALDAEEVDVDDLYGTPIHPHNASRTAPNAPRDG